MDRIDIKTKIQEKTNFFTIGPVVFASATQTCVTELKEESIVTHLLLSLCTPMNAIMVKLTLYLCIVTYQRASEYTTLGFVN
jgi:hypothetical protein